VYLVTPGRDSVPTLVLSNVLVVTAGRSDGAAVATLRLPASAVATIIAAEGAGSLRLVLRTAPGTP
jgi:Flp pilus assembly protein CpaB